MSKLTPIVVGDNGGVICIDGDGSFFGTAKLGKEHMIIDITALPDARILMDDDQRLLLLTGPIGRYPHGVLDDKIEASAITLVEACLNPEGILKTPVPNRFVIEGIS